jgi:tryptophan-rich sensory protein
MGIENQTEPASQKFHATLVLLGFLAACFFVGGISSTFSVAAIPQWYAALSKPSFNPPNWVFGPAWTLLYTLMAIAAWLVWKQPISAPGSAALRTAGLRLWWLQLLLNFAWSWIFFHQHQLAGALFEIVLLWLAIVATTVLFVKVSRLAAWLMAPYVAWVAFASVLTYEIWRLNAA